MAQKEKVCSKYRINQTNVGGKKNDQKKTPCQLHHESTKADPDIGAAHTRAHTRTHVAIA